MFNRGVFSSLRSNIIVTFDTRNNYFLHDDEAYHRARDISSDDEIYRQARSKQKVEISE